MATDHVEDAVQGKYPRTAKHELVYANKRDLLVFAWKMNPKPTACGFVFGLPLVGLGSLAVQTSIEAATDLAKFCGTGENTC